MSTRPPAASLRSHVQVPVSPRGRDDVTARFFTFDGLVDGRDHVALGFGGYAAQPGARMRQPRAGIPLVRVHSECLTGDVFGSQRCDCGPQLDEAVCELERHGGYLLYLRQEGRGIGLTAKLDAYALQDRGLDTYEANVALGYAEDQRDYTVAAQMLEALGVSRIDLLTNNPDKARQLRSLGVSVRRVIPTGVHLSVANAAYLAAKVNRTAHTISLPASVTMELGEGDAS
jgi:GTP cyclohydrolase II